MKRKLYRTTQVRESIVKDIIRVYKTRDKSEKFDLTEVINRVCKAYGYKRVDHIYAILNEDIGENKSTLSWVCRHGNSI